MHTRTIGIYSAVSNFNYDTYSHYNHVTGRSDVSRMIITCSVGLSQPLKGTWRRTSPSSPVPRYWSRLAGCQGLPSCADNYAGVQISPTFSFQERVFRSARISHQVYDWSLSPE